MERLIYHIDVNSAFLSWSACRMIKEDPDALDLRTVPAIVGGDQESRHGIVLTKSIPAKRYGIQTGEAIVDARKKCPDLIIIPPEYDLYVDSSRALVDLLKKYAPKVEQYSIDECWTDFSGTEHLYGWPTVMAEELCAMIYRELGFTVNIGVSSSKLLAKMASDFKKPNRVHTLFPTEIQQKMWPLPVGDLFFVGRATVRKLWNLGIVTIGDLARTDPRVLRSHLKKHGEIIWGLANGFDIGDIRNEVVPNKGYGNSMTVPYDVRDLETGKMVLLSLAEMVGSRLRADEAKISVVSVSLTSNIFERCSHQKQLFSQTDVTEEIYRAACILFEELWDHKTLIRQMGIHTSRVTTDKIRQYNLFDLDKYERLEKWNRSIDLIRERYGEDSVMRARFLDNKIKHMNGGVHEDKRSGVTKPV